MAIICKNCNGRGKIVHECSDCVVGQRCEYCDGTGVAPDRETGDDQFDDENSYDAPQSLQDAL